MVGWATETDSEEIAYYPGDAYTKNTDITLYAVWDAETYTLYVDGSGGEGSVESVTAADGDSVVLGAAPERSGYDFAGWAFSADAEQADFAVGDSYRFMSPVYVQRFDDYYTFYYENGEMTDGYHGDGVYLDGNSVSGSAYAQIYDSYQFIDWSDGMTVSMWVKADGELAADTPLCNLDIAGVGFAAVTASLESAMNTTGNSDTVDYETIKTEITGTESRLVPGEWTLVTAVYHEDGVYVYANGELVSNAAYEGNGVTYAVLAEQLRLVETVRVGTWNCPWSTSGDFRGTVDELVIFNKALTDEELARFIADELNSEGTYNEEANPYDVTLYAVWTERDEPEVPAESIEISVEGGTAKPGETVDVVIRLDNNPGVLGGVNVTYDSDVLALTSYLQGDALSSMTFFADGDQTSVPYGIMWNGMDSNDTSTGELVTLRFTVASDAAAGEYPITVTCEEGDIFDENEADVPVIFTNGTVNIVEFLYGDVNEDGAVNGIDVILLGRHIVGGYEIAVFNEDAADVNLDDKINGKDLTRIRRYIAGGFDVELGQ